MFLIDRRNDAFSASRRLIFSASVISASLPHEAYGFPAAFGLIHVKIAQPRRIPRNPVKQKFARNYGVHLDGVRAYAQDAAGDLPNYGSVTQPNSGLPSQLTTYIHPKVIRAVITPTKAAETYGEAKNGDWLLDTTMFPMVSYTGYPVSYGDFDTGGKAEVNANWEFRQSFHYSLFTEWGEREAARMGLGNLDWVAEKQLASISVLNKQQNLTYLFGVSGLANYGVLNDPSLPPAITPTQKAAQTGTGTVTQWTQTNDPLAVYQDILALFNQLNMQTGGIVTMEDRLVLTIPTALQQVMGYTNQFNLKLRDVLKDNFPNLEVKTLPELGVAMSGENQKINTVQLFLPEIEGTETVYCGFTEKLRTHRLEQYSSHARQKKTQGTWGGIIRFPLAFATMVGV